MKFLKKNIKNWVLRDESHSGLNLKDRKDLYYKAGLYFLKHKTFIPEEMKINKPILVFRGMSLSSKEYKFLLETGNIWRQTELKNFPMSWTKSLEGTMDFSFSSNYRNKRVYGIIISRILLPEQIIIDIHNLTHLFPLKDNKRIRTLLSAEKEILADSSSLLKIKKECIMEIPLLPKIKFKKQ